MASGSGRPGSRVDFKRTEDGRILLTTEATGLAESPLRKLRGHAGAGLDTDAIMALTRGEE